MNAGKQREQGDVLKSDCEGREGYHCGQGLGEGLSVEGTIELAHEWQEAASPESIGEERSRQRDQLAQPPWGPERPGAFEMQEDASAGHEGWVGGGRARVVSYSGCQVDNEFPESRSQSREMGADRMLILMLIFAAISQSHFISLNT